MYSVSVLLYAKHTPYPTAFPPTPHKPAIQTATSKTDPVASANLCFGTSLEPVNMDIEYRSACQLSQANTARQTRNILAQEKKARGSVFKEGWGLFRVGVLVGISIYRLRLTHPPPSKHQICGNKKASG